MSTTRNVAIRRRIELTAAPIAQIEQSPTLEYPAASSLQPVPHDEVFDDKGDLTLIVGENEERFRVCSRALARHSPVFKTMLFGGWAESSQSATTTTGKARSWEVELPDDEAEPAAKAFHIVHGNFEMVYTFEFDEDGLYRLLTFTNKYDMTAIIRPWSQKWFQPMKDSENLVMLFIAWELGVAPVFTRMARMIAHSCQRDTEGGIMIFKDEKAIFLEDYEYLVPPKLLETISIVRQAALTKLIDEFRNSWEHLTSPKSTGERINHPYASFGCICAPSPTMSLLGWFIIYARKAHLFRFLDLGTPVEGMAAPSQPPIQEAWTDSVNALASVIASVWDIDATGHRCGNSYNCICGLRNLRDKTKAVELDIASWDILANSMVDYDYLPRLQKQAQKTGILG